MAKLSHQTKEIIQIVIFLAVVGILMTVFVIYPLNKVKDIMARDNIDDFNSDSLVTNDPTAFVDSGLPADTFHVDTDGLTSLACLFIPPVDSAIGTIILLHDDGETRDSLLAVATSLHQTNFAVVLCDQRASGRSSGKYRGDGMLEAEDLTAVISWLNLREKISHPLIVAGWSLGADGAILAAEEEDRIDLVLADSPYLSSSRYIDKLKEKHDMYWLPLFRTVIWFWFEIRSGYEPTYRDLEDINAVSCKTFLYLDEESSSDEEVQKLIELSGSENLIVKTEKLSLESILKETGHLIATPVE